MKIYLGRVMTALDEDALLDDTNDIMSHVLDWGTYVGTNERDVIAKMAEAVKRDLLNVDEYASVESYTIDEQTKSIAFVCIDSEGDRQNVLASFSIETHTLGDDKPDDAIVPFEVTEANVESVHTHLEGVMEVLSDDGDTSSERYQACSQALGASCGVTLPVTINVPQWLATELQDAIEDDEDL